jgi:LPXTG-motif cell wall-anchored protein
MPMNLVQQGVILAPSAGTDEGPPAGTTEAKQDHSKLIMWSIIVAGGLAVVGTGVYLARRKRR